MDGAGGHKAKATSAMRRGRNVRKGGKQTLTPRSRDDGSIVDQRELFSAMNLFISRSTSRAFVSQMKWLALGMRITRAFGLRAAKSSACVAASAARLSDFVLVQSVSHLGGTATIERMGTLIRVNMRAPFTMADCSAIWGPD